MRLPLGLVAATMLATASGAQELDIVGRASVADGDTIEINEVLIRLYGVDAPEAGQKCAKGNGGSWACGDRATEVIAAMVEDREVSCKIRGSDEVDRSLGVCEVDGININERMVVEGYAWALLTQSDDYADFESEARSNGLGVWQAQSVTPWDYRAEQWKLAEQDAPGGCPIKGNISRGTQIYQTPWSPWYGRTKIDESKGERWFCSEREAIDAGWRAPFWR